MIKLILLLTFTLTDLNSFIITTPQPILNFDYDLLQTGTKTLTQSNNIGPAPLFQAFYTKTFTKMNQNLPNTYTAFLGWRGAHIYFHKQSQNAVSYYTAITQKNPTNIQIYVSSDFSDTIVFIGVNFLLIHQSFVTNKFMYGEQFHIPTDCPAVVPGWTVCDNPVPFVIPPTGWTPLVFINYLRFYRDQLYTSYDLVLFFSVQIIDASNINIKLQFGRKGLLQQCTVSVVVYKDTLVDQSVNKVLILSTFQNTSPLTLIVYTPLSISLLPVKMYESNVFFGLSQIISRSMEFHYDIFPDAVSFTLIGSIYFPVTVAYFKGFVISGYTCTDPHYFHEFSQQCDTCPILHCKSCVADVLGVVMCLQCYDNYFISPDKLLCDCTMDAIANICQTLIFPDQIGCLNAQRFNGDAKCLFCSPAEYKILSIDNKCVCINGYNDDNFDGICQQTCGDGLIFSAQCDDGNVIQNDGCSKICMIQIGFKCDQSQPSYCQSLSMIRYKFGQVKKNQFSNNAEITLFIKNPKQTLPFSILKKQLQPQSTHIKLFFTSNQYPFQEIQIQDVNLIQIDGNYMIKFSFQFQFTLQSYDGKIVLDYEKTRYLQDKQEIRFQTQGIDKPLVYSSNLQSFKTIGFANLAFVGLNFIALIISLLSPKFIGLELDILFIGLFKYFM